MVSALSQRREIYGVLRNPKPWFQMQGLPLVPDDLRMVAASTAASTVVISNSSRRARARALLQAAAGCSRLRRAPSQLTRADARAGLAPRPRTCPCLTL